MKKDEIRILRLVRLYTCLGRSRHVERRCRGETIDEKTRTAVGEDDGKSCDFQDS